MIVWGGGGMSTVTLDSVVRLEAAARKKLGLFTAADAKAFGVSPALVGYHSRPGGRWSRALPGIYGLVAEADDWRRPLLAGLLWAGDAAVLSHRAAGSVLGLDGIPSPAPELWALRARVPRGVIVHRGVVEPGAIATTGLLRHTTIVRTVVDLAAVLDDETLEIVIESALRRDRALEPVLRLAAGGGRRGALRLGRVLDRRPAGAPPTESELETRFLQVIRLVDLPPPRRQYRVVVDGRHTARLDFCWPEAGLWVETDGRATHDNATAFYADRRRQNDLIARLDWRILRFGWSDVVDRPSSTARQTLELYRAGLRRHSPDGALAGSAGGRRDAAARVAAN
jgi:very-short-patch-repair endonuclease